MLLFSFACNEYTVISKEYTGPLDFDITGVECVYIYVYIFVCMLRIDQRNWAVHKAEFWCTEVTFGTLQRVLVLRPKFQLLAEL